MVSRYRIERDNYFMIVLGLQEQISCDNKAFEDAQDEDYEDQHAGYDESNDEILGEEEKYDEMTPDEIYEAEQLKLNNNIQEDDPEPEGNNENNIEMNADDIQDEDEEPANETENEEAR